MKRTFQQFKIGKYNFQENLLNEAEGISTSHAKFPLSFRPLTEFLTVIPGSDTTRGRILNWILSEGLMQASLGREKLLSQINEALEKEGVFANVEAPVKVEPKTLTQKPNGTQQKVVGEMALSAYDVWGSDYPHQRNIKEFLTSLDLFSPIAWERTVLPNDPSTKLLYLADEIFKKSSQYGMGILEYYKENYEPKFMVIDVADDKGSQYRYDIENIRKECEKIYKRSFHYGGFDGYIQFIEKGDWKPEIQKRSIISPNEQYGINVSPARQYDTKNKVFKDIDEEKLKQIRRNKIQYNFQGTSFTPSDETALTAIRNMRFRFINTIKKNPNIPKEDKEYLNGISELIKSLEISEVELRKGKGKPAAKLGLQGKGLNNRDINSLPYPLTVNKFYFLIREGLKAPFTRFDPNTFEDLSVVDYNVADGKLTFKLNETQIEELIQFIFKETTKVDENTYEGTYKNEFRWKDPEAPQFMRDMRPKSPNVRFQLIPVLNAALLKDPEYNQILKQTVYNIKDISSKDFAIKLKEEKVKLDKPPNPNAEPDEIDPKLNTLLNNNFSWELTGQQKKYGYKTPFDPIFNPNYKQSSLLKSKVYGWLKNPSGIRIRIEKDGNNWFMYLPSPAGSHYALPANHGKANLPLLGGPENLLSGGIEGGHVKANTVGPIKWNEILEKLKQGYKGGLGECEWVENTTKPKKESINKTYDETNLPSIKGGITIAKGWFNNLKRNQFPNLDKPSDLFDENELYFWGLEGLRLHANDPAYQVGFLSQEEFNKFTGHQDSRIKKLHKNINLSQERKKQSVALQKGQFNYKSLPKGLDAIFARSGIYDNPQDFDEEDVKTFDIITNYVQNIIKETKANKEFFILDKMKNNMLETGQVEQNVLDALAYNGFQYRKRMIAKYILEQMNKELPSKETNIQQIPQAKGEEGETSTFDFATHGREERGEYEASKEDLKALDIESLYKQLNVEMPKFDPSNIELSSSKVKKSVGGTTSSPINDFLYMLKGKKPKTSSQGASSVVQQRQIPSEQKPNIVTQPKPLEKPTRSILDLFNIERPKTSSQDVSSVIQQRQISPEPKPTIVTQPKPLEKPTKSILDLFNIERPKPSNEHLISFLKWRKMTEMAGTSVVFDKNKSKPKSGSGFNWWGAPGNLGGTMISGEADTAKSDPDGKKGIRSGKRSK